MRVWRRGVGTFLVCVLGATAFGAATAEGEPIDALAFEDDRALTLSAAEAAAGVTETVCNQGTEPLPSVRARLVKFRFATGGTPVTETDALTPPVDPGISSALEPDSCLQLNVKLAAGSTPDPGVYPGQLVVSAPGVKLVRKSVSMDLSAAAAPVAKSASATAKLEGIRQGPIGQRSDDVGLSGGGDLALDRPPTGTLDLPSKDTFVGNVLKDNEVGELYVDGPADYSVEGVILLPLRVERIDEVGEYEGKVDLTGATKSEDLIPVELKVTDALWCALLAILLGAWLGLWPQLWARRWRPEKDLHQRHRSLVERYRVAGTYWTEYGQKAPVLCAIAPPGETAIKEYADGVNSAIRTYAKSTVFFDTESDASKAIEESLAQADADSDCVKDETCLAAALTELDTALHGLEALIASTFPVERPPGFVASAAALLQAGELKVGEATERTGKAREYSSFIASWTKLAADVRRYLLWAYFLDQLADAGRLRPADAERLERALARIEEAKQEMLDAVDPDSLEKLGAGKDLEHAYETLAYLGARYGVWVAPEVARHDPDAALMQEMIDGFDLSTEAVMARYVEGEIGALSVIDDAAELLVDSARAVALVAGSRWLWDGLALGLALAVALVGALSAVYFGKVFGSLEDYLTVILVGTASQVLTKALLDFAASYWTTPVPGQPKVAVADSPAVLTSGPETKGAGDAQSAQP